MKWLDEFFERRSRGVAQSASRRSALAGVGKLLVGAAFVLPVLPFDRTAQAAGAAAAKRSSGKAPTDTDCEYWRYCAQDGYLCSCCGGNASTCPPGTEASKVSWIGTCHNPEDGRDYLISYNDCCGKTACGRCFCNTNEREMPAYRMALHNDINWCMTNDSTMFHCTLATVVGLMQGKS